jgi:arginyl-tRNA synthetase
MSPLSKVKSQIIKAAAAVYPGSALTEADIVPTPNPALGDLAVPMFKLAKAAGKAPGAIAEELREKIQLPISIAGAEVAGPYFNVRLDKIQFAKETLSAIAKQKSSYGDRKKTKEKVMVEFVAPNINKPLHLGHLRNAVLGESLCRLLEARGDKVIRANLLSDRGIGVTRAMLAYERWGGTETPVSRGVKSDRFVGDFYVMYEQKHKADLSLDEAVNEMLRKWEAGDRGARSLWRTITNWVIAGQNATLKTLGVKFDKVYRESALYEEGKKMALAACEKSLLAKDDKGNIVARIPGKPDKVVLRADGTAVYITTDLALTRKKMEENRLSRCLWVVGAEQDLHLEQLFGIMRLLGYGWADRLEHVSYGHVALPEGRMKSREGTVVEIDELIEHLSKLAEAEVRERHDFLSESEIERRAEEIALGAIKFYLLSVSPESGMTFNPKESLSFTGKTGPYLQYTNARTLSVLRKAADGKSGAGRTDVSKLTEPAEWKLILDLASFPDAVAAAAAERDPSVIARYGYELSKAFAEFYEQVPVLKAEASVRRARLSLLRAVQTVLAKSLYLLGIPAPKEM